MGTTPRDNMSKSVSLYTTAAALAAGDRILGPDRVWKPTTPMQERWLKEVYAPCRESLPNIREIVSNATWSGAEHVAFLQKYGWKAQIKEPAPDSFLTAGIMKLGVEWLEEGTREQITLPDGAIVNAAAEVSAGVKIYRSPVHDQPVASVRTKSGYAVWMTRIDTDADDLDLAALANRVFAPSHPGCGDPASDDPSIPAFPAQFEEIKGYGAVRFPMVDLMQKRSLDYMLNLFTFTDPGQRAWVAQAVQQLGFKMNHKGAEARAADEMEVTTESIHVGPRPVIIDGPFLLSITRPGLRQPLFVTHVTQDDWKDPGEF